MGETFTVTKEMKIETKESLIDIIYNEDFLKENSKYDNIYLDSKNKLSIYKKNNRCKNPRKHRRILRKLESKYITPTQRLILIAGNQIIQMGHQAIEFMKQNSDAMEQFKQFHEENKASKSLAAKNNI